MDTLMPQHIAKGVARGDLDPFTKMPFLGENVSAGLVLDGTYQLKNFKPERKKLDLPAQKNLLTNYFCFASLEAKRIFRAPRTTPKHPDPKDESSPSPAEHVTDEATACNINCSSASLLNPGNLGMVPPKHTVSNNNGVIINASYISFGG
ncbi:hypothetical protein L1049_010094 [Liquidambar formosana]|uniref:Uncharacterized protein n=1 Tax=Liquidambar formosana TaxID=63359 RepID=A0AAP0N6X3_LIQFO